MLRQYLTLFKGMRTDWIKGMKHRLHTELMWALLACACAAPWIAYVMIEYINLDFWRDELYSLDNFVFVPITTVVTDYHAPNNHILSNLINHIYLRSFGIDDVDILRDPWKIRILMLLYSLIALIYVYRIGKDFFSPFAGIISVIILGSTLPFLNFAVQVRGYSLSIMLVSIMFYYMTRYYRKENKKDALLIVMTICLAIYTIPSNIYIFMSIVIFWSITLFLTIFPKNTHQRNNRTQHKTRLVTLALAGSAVSAILYLPIFLSIADNEYVTGVYINTKPFNMRTLTVLMPQFFDHIISKRWILIIVAVYGIIRSFRDHSRRLREYILFSLMLTSSFLPFIISAIRGDNPYDRTFIPVAIPFSIAWGVALSWAINNLAHRLRFMILIAIFGITLNSFFLTVNHRNNLLRLGIETGRDISNIMTNYFQKYYTPSFLMKEFVVQYQDGGLFTRYGWVDKAALRYMLYWMEIYGKSIDEWQKSMEHGLEEEWLLSGKPIYIFTNNISLPAFLEARYPELRCRRITSPDHLGLVVQCDHRNRSEDLNPAPSDASRPLISLGRGWYGAETFGAQTYRWGSSDNTIWVVNPYNTPIHATLALTLESYETTRPVELWDGRHLAARWEVQRPVRTYRVGVTIPSGYARLRLRAPTTYDPRSRRDVSVVALRVRIADYVVESK